MSDLKLGNLIEGEAKRDAIHVAIAPVFAAERLAPGQHVGFIGDTVGACKNSIGVVDPYLQAAVFKGDRFWLFLYPNTVTSLSHHWEHPAFEEKNELLDSAKQVLHATAKDAGLSYEALMEAAQDFLDNGEYMCQGGRWEGFGVPDNFWDSYERVTDVKVPHEKRYSFFSCSC